MQFFGQKKYYLLASFLVIAITVAIYSGIDVLLVSNSKKQQISEVYLVPIAQIPILKEKLLSFTEGSGYQTEKVTAQAGSASLEPTSYVPFDEFSKTITAKSAYVEDIDTGTVLFERNSERILLPASTTKLMTALVALEEYSVDQIITVPQLPEITGLTHEFEVGEQIIVGDLLKAALIQSNNDAAYILAYNSKNSLDGFVNRMNEKAKELNLKSTQFENPVGFDNDTQRSSAHDLVVLSKVFMQNEFLASVVAMQDAIIKDISGEFEHVLKSTHQLLGVDPTVVGIKTGTTEGAAQVLITQFNREGRTIIVVVMGSEDRYLETTKLVDWVFQSYLWVDLENMI